MASRGYITGPREIGYFQKHAWSRWNGVTPEFEVTLPLRDNTQSGMSLHVERAPGRRRSVDGLWLEAMEAD